MIKTINIPSVESTHSAKTIYTTVSDILDDLGFNQHLIDELSTNQVERDVGLTLKMSEQLDNLIRDGRFPFSIEKQLDGFFGESTGSSNVTTLKIEKQMNIREVLELFKTTGQLDDALEIISAVSSENDPKPEVVLAYGIGQYAKGWFAEQIIADHFDGMSKGSVSNDKGGIDFYFDGDTVQVGSITRYNSRQSEMKSDNLRHMLYQWTGNGEIIVGDMQEVINASNDMASDAGLSKTLVKRSAGNLKINKEVGRSFRYLWW